jgi:hypothetical protein
VCINVCACYPRPFGCVRRHVPPALPRSGIAVPGSPTAVAEPAPEPGCAVVAWDRHDYISEDGEDDVFHWASGVPSSLTEREYVRALSARYPDRVFGQADRTLNISGHTHQCWCLCQVRRIRGVSLLACLQNPGEKRIDAARQLRTQGYVCTCMYGYISKTS